MRPERVTEVVLRPWAGGDLPLLRRLLGDPSMMEHLGGPETPGQTRRRHQRYLSMNHQPGQGEMLVMLVAGQPVGSIGDWARD